MTNALPAQYEWLTKLGTLPRMVTEAIALYGTVETPGAASSPTIMAWRDEAKKAGLNVNGYSADEVPWCGLFMAVVALRAGKDAPKFPLWALNWSGFGKPGRQPVLGDVLTFVRSGGGHVALYIAEDRSAYHCLGGNQGDRVSIARVEKKRLHSVSRPLVKFGPAASAVPYFVGATGSLSANEA